MLTLVERQPRTTAISSSKVMRLCRQARLLAAMWRSRERQRKALARLDDRLLADIGLTREAQWWNARSCSGGPRDRDFCVDCARLDYAQFLGRSRGCTLTDAFGS
jgi:uncharacterized protein YjiS (DUF1127 family)